MKIALLLTCGDEFPLGATVHRNEAEAYEALRQIVMLDLDEEDVPLEGDVDNIVNAAINIPLFSWEIQEIDLKELHSQESGAADVQLVYDLMGALSVGLDDLELYGHIEDRDDLRNDVPTTFDLAVEVGVSVGGSDDEMVSYHQATADHVGGQLAQYGLLEEED